MGGGTQQSQQSTTQQLTPQQQQLSNMALPYYQQFAGSNIQMPGGSQSVAPFSPAQLAGQQAVLGTAGFGGAGGGGYGAPTGGGGGFGGGGATGSWAENQPSGYGAGGMFNTPYSGPFQASPSAPLPEAQPTWTQVGGPTAAGGGQIPGMGAGGFLDPTGTAVNPNFNMTGTAAPVGGPAQGNTPGGPTAQAAPPPATPAAPAASTANAATPGAGASPAAPAGGTMPNAQPTPYLPPGQTGGVGPGGIQQGGMQMQQVLNPAAATNAYLSGGAFLDPGSNPYVQNAVQAATAPIFQDLAQRTLPAQQATAAAGAGANFGGSREGTQEAQDVLNAYRTAGQTGAGIMNTALGQGLQATGQAIGQAPGTAESLLAPGAAAEAVGGEQQTQLQNFINAQNQSQMFQQLLPLLKGQLMAQGAGALPGGGTTTTGTGTSSPSPLSTALGIGSTAGGLMSGIGALAAAGLLV